MNIREILEKHGIEGEATARIEQAINKAVGDEFVDKQRYKERLREVAELKEALQTAAEDSDAAAGWKEKYEAEAKAHKDTRDGYTAEKQAAEIDALVTAQLRAAGMNEKVIPKALKLYDRSMVERGRDGALINADKLLDGFKNDWGDFFGSVTQYGAGVATPPATVQGAAQPKNLGDALKQYYDRMESKN